MMKIEILVPVGNFEMLSTAINSGADAVYLGVKGLNMRSSAKNFTVQQIKKAIQKAHNNNVKVYVTLNTIIFENEIKKIKNIIKKLKEYRVDAIIAWDLSILKEAKKLNIPIHLSTQASVSNSIAIKEYKNYGIKRVVLARECALKEIKQISKKTNIELEVFAHGAMCVSISGRCFMSQFQYGKSANRGECYQPCRRHYTLTDTETKEQLVIENNYVLSPKDLCTIHILDKIINSGVTSLKIEGRARSPEYVNTTVKVYKEAVNLALNKKLTKSKKKLLIKKLKEVYNRDFSTGFYLGRPIQDFWNIYGGKPKYKKQYLGKIINYYPKAKAFYAKLNTGNLKIGDTLWIIGPTTGFIQTKTKELRNEQGKTIKTANKGETFTTKIKTKVRKNDKVYKRIKIKS